MPATSFALMLILEVTAVGCSTEPTRFYLLDSRAPAVGTKHSGGIWLGIEPVTLPGYLDRTEIITRVTAYRLNAAIHDIWAEPLDVNATNFLADALAQLMHPVRIILLANESANTDYNLNVNIERFERQPDDAVRLAAAWTVEHAESGVPEIVEATSIRERVIGKGYNAIVAAMSRALNRLSQEIAIDLNGLRPSGPDV